KVNPNLVNSQRFDGSVKRLKWLSQRLGQQASRLGQHGSNSAGLASNSAGLGSNSQTSGGAWWRVKTPMWVISAASGSSRRDLRFDMQ
ncbi:hypothetical protein HAX54_052100, partial [Datura stramonium]|nr:hypothetical protein [Datura stramonium]